MSAVLLPEDFKRVMLLQKFVSARVKIKIEKPPPNVVALTRSNDPPLHSVSVDLRNRLQEVDTCITGLDRDITHMKNYIDILVDLREKYKPFKAKYKVVLHPIRRLPAEVLLEIFSQCMASQNLDQLDQCHATPSHVISNTPWILAHVCRRWRDIVLTAPRLWTTISIDFSKLGSRKDSSMISMMSHYLRFSRDLPLTVSITSMATKSHPLLPLLFSHSSRWEKVYLHLPLTSFVLLSSIVKGSLPLLHYAHLQTCDTARELWARMGVTIDAFQHAPQLKTLRVDVIPALVQHFVLPWKQINHCTYLCAIGYGYPRPDNSDFLHVLRRVGAETCVFSLADQLSLSALSPARHDTLRNLNLTSRSMRSIGQLLDMLTTPSLTHLEINIVKERVEQEDDGRAIVHFIERSSCPLKELRIKGWHGMPEFLIVRLFRAAPTLDRVNVGVPNLVALLRKAGLDF